MRDIFDPSGAFGPQQDINTAPYLPHSGTLTQFRVDGRACTCRTLQVCNKTSINALAEFPQPC